MKIPLLIQAKPRSNFVYCYSYLLPGQWRIESDHKNSELALSPDWIKFEDGILIDGGGVFSVKCLMAGTEQSISVTAHKVK